jgi:hypothetical protein
MGMEDSRLFLASPCAWRYSSYSQDNSFLKYLGLTIKELMPPVIIYVPQSMGCPVGTH